MWCYYLAFRYEETEARAVERGVPVLTVLEGPGFPLLFLFFFKALFTLFIYLFMAVLGLCFCVYIISIFSNIA